MRAISSEIEIEAAPERIWDVLTDFDSYSEWNPFMDRVSGRALRDSRLRISMRRPGGHRLRFPARVVAAERPRELAWEGRGWAWWPGLMHGERRITIAPAGEGRSRVCMTTTFTGLLSPWMGWIDHYRPAFEQMERALKTRAEAP